MRSRPDPCSEALSDLVFSTYLGGSDRESLVDSVRFPIGEGDIAVDDAGNAYVTGRTESQDFPTVNALQPSQGCSTSNAFVASMRNRR
ncbi:MAG: SBBP repeat-containing protein [Planctomycetes bacterium]|nr:SBBP repeat-containing protein [Planctomycetota bacterium]